MKQDNSGNAAYLPKADYYGSEGYLGYGGYKDASGCRNLFFFLAVFALALIIVGVLAIVL